MKTNCLSVSWNWHNWSDCPAYGLVFCSHGVLSGVGSKIVNMFNTRDQTPDLGPGYEVFTRCLLSGVSSAGLSAGQLYVVWTPYKSLPVWTVLQRFLRCREKPAVGNCSWLFARAGMKRVLGAHASVKLWRLFITLTVTAHGTFWIMDTWHPSHERSARRTCIAPQYYWLSEAKSQASRVKLKHSWSVLTLTPSARLRVFDACFYDECRQQKRHVRCSLRVGSNELITHHDTERSFWLAELRFMHKLNDTKRGQLWCCHAHIESQRVRHVRCGDRSTNFWVARSHRHWASAALYKCRFKGVIFQEESWWHSCFYSERQWADLKYCIIRACRRSIRGKTDSWFLHRRHRRLIRFQCGS